MSRSSHVRRGTCAVLAGALFGLTVAAGAGGAAAQEPIERTDPVVLILDASGSMNADDGTGRPKIEAAKLALAQVIRLLPPGLPVGLVLYGHRSSSDNKKAGCRDVKVVQPVAPLDPDRLSRKVAGIEASGFTPIGLALQRAADALPADQGGTIILVSDGVDTCAPPDPCATALEIGSRREVDIRVETVGFQVDAKARAQLRCIADAAGGKYRDADDAGQLAEALYQVQGNPVTGGRGPADAPVLSSGQYRDTLRLGDERWYAVDLADGQSLTVTSTLGNRRQGPHPRRATFSGRLTRDDLLGSLKCNTDAASGVGPAPLPITLEGAEIDTGAGTGECTEAGRHFVVLTIDDPYAEDRSGSEADPYAEIEYGVELIVAVEGDPIPPPSPTPTPTPAAAPPVPEPPPTDGVSVGVRMLTAIGFALLGLFAGSFTARAFGA